MIWSRALGEQILHSVVWLTHLLGALKYKLLPASPGVTKQSRIQVLSWPKVTLTKEVGSKLNDVIVSEVVVVAQR